MRNRLLSWTGGLMCSAALEWLAMGAASAAEIDVSPVRLELDSGARGVVMNVRNKSSESTRFQASVYSWVQDEEGRMSLAPTQDLFFFPSLLTLEPGESRPIRVGSSSAPQDTERSFRIVVEELPPLQPSTQVTGLNVLTRVSVPVFVAPKKKTVQGKIAQAVLRESKFHVRVQNPGTVNFFIRNLRVRGLDAKGKRLVEKEEPGWYVLAGDAQVFAMEVAGKACRQVRTVEVEMETDQGVLRQTSPVDSPAPCAR
ncbi:fimbria/pilus periplasmic chaperone [Myxococcus sp. SDU36]|nr:fimbria/pilus periplasmic chaperone [Myxococcus sp. SDU36]